MLRYRISAYVTVDYEEIEAESEEEAQDIAWEKAEQALGVSVELIEDEEEDA
jgi:hypothetical protein